MGLMDKIRDMFTEEVEEQIEEEPIKKEMIQVEIPAPKQKEEEEAPIKKEEKPSPIFFDDTDFAGLEPPKKQKPSIKLNTYEKPKKQEEKKEVKKFKPTPIISPIYGVLDKNYHKEDIKTKNNSNNTTYYNHKDVSIDDIRKKAYGTLEDELEITLFGEPEVEKEPVQENEIDMFDELLEDQPVEKENVDDSDLFNLIDSMYEKEDDKNGNS
jgi:hypothetical protein